ncbi:MAG: hypothetical protein KAT65_08815 [Methanophagales archaeon]|nr:hypothetical protein [Methanophagales archaeon]
MSTIVSADDGRWRYFACLPPVVSRFQVADYELFFHIANIVSKEDIKVAVYVCTRENN